jgi:hypothetical protein
MYCTLAATTLGGFSFTLRVLRVGFFSAPRFVSETIA